MDWAQLVAKPSHVFDREADWQALASFIADDRSHSTLGVVSGRRRQGKTFLLSALAEQTGGFYFEAAEATETESLRMFGAALARYAGSPASYAFSGWDQALAAMFEVARDHPIPLIIDEFPYLIKASPALPSLLQRELDARGPARPGTSQARVLVCGSALSVMGKLLAGSAPLRGRAGLELVVKPLGLADMARFWGLADPRLAVMVHAIVGGTPAYRREFVRDDAPRGMDDFDDWVARAVLNPRTPLFREARYLLAEETEIRDPALYHSVLAAVAEGNGTRGGIANYIGRRTADISHPLTVLEDAGLLAREPDAFRSGRSRYRITEPLLVFYQAIMRPHWSRLERGQALEVWADTRHRFDAHVMGPHFEALCREASMLAGSDLFGVAPGEVMAGTVADPANRTQLEVDVVVFAPTSANRPKKIVALGEAKWTETMGRRHLDRLRRARDLLAANGYDAGDAALACFGDSFASDLPTHAGRDRVVLVGPERIVATDHGQ